MRQNQFHNEYALNNTFGAAIEAGARKQDLGHPSAATRLRARISAAKLDRQVDEGAVPTPGSPLAAHMERLTSIREREHVARAFRRVLQTGDQSPVAVSLRVPALANRVDECRGVIDDITLRLHSPRPVEAKGMARLRMLLSDGTGPLYFEGQGSLAGQVRGALAAL